MRGETLPTAEAVEKSKLIIWVAITLVIVIISLVLIGVELAKWKEFQIQAKSNSLFGTILTTIINDH